MTIRQQIADLLRHEPIEFIRANGASVTGFFRGLTANGGHLRYSVGTGRNRYVAITDLVEIARTR